MPLSPQIHDTLKGLYSAASTTGFVYGNPKHPHIRALVSGGMIAGNVADIDPTNSEKHAFSVTVAGAAELGLQPADATIEGAVPVTQVPEKGKGGRGSRGPNVVPVIVASVAKMGLPTDFVKRGGNRGETYGFGKLTAPEAGQEGAIMYDSFFVQATDEMPEPANTLRAAVTSANKRYGDKGVKFKHFIMKLDPQTGLAGVRVFRVE